MKTTLQLYTCPRCFMCTDKKTNMDRHFARKTQCACKNESQLVLTDEIKEIVLRDRIYHIPKEPKNVPKLVTNTVMNNYFSGPLDKIRALTEYRNTKMMTIDQSIDEKCFDKKQKYELNHNIYYNKLTIDDLLQILDDISTSSDPEFKDFNILYDKKQNKVSFVEDDGTSPVGVSVNLNSFSPTRNVDAGILKIPTTSPERVVVKRPIE